MILLFGDNAAKSTSSKKNSGVKNNPVENAGILAMNASEAKSLLTIGEYDTYISNNPYAVDYSMYADYDSSSADDSGFMSNFSAAVAVLGDCGFGFGGADASFSSGSSFSGASCSSFTSVG